MGSVIILGLESSITGHLQYFELLDLSPISCSPYLSASIRYLLRPSERIATPKPNCPAPPGSQPVWPVTSWTFFPLLPPPPPPKILAPCFAAWPLSDFYSTRLTLPLHFLFLSIHIPINQPAFLHTRDIVTSLHTLPAIAPRSTTPYSSDLDSLTTSTTLSSFVSLILHLFGKPNAPPPEHNLFT